MMLRRERSRTTAAHKVKGWSDGVWPREPRRSHRGQCSSNVTALWVRRRYSRDLIVRTCHKSIMRTRQVINCGVEQAARATRETAYLRRREQDTFSCFHRRPTEVVGGWRGRATLRSRGVQRGSTARREYTVIILRLSQFSLR